LGGLDRDAVVSAWGIDPKDAPRSGVVGKPVLRANGGMSSIDRMAETLGEYGYLPRDEHGKIDLHDFENLFGQELRGEKVYASAGIEAQAERRQADMEAQFLAAEAEQAFREAFRLAPIQPEYWLELGELYSFKIQDKEKARLFYLEALERSSQNLNVVKAYANFLGDIEKDYSEAIKHWQILADKDKKNQVDYLAKIEELKLRIDGR